MPLPARPLQHRPHPNCSTHLRNWKATTLCQLQRGRGRKSASGTRVRRTVLSKCTRESHVTLADHLPIGTYVPESGRLCIPTQGVWISWSIGLHSARTRRRYRALPLYTLKAYRLTFVCSTTSRWNTTHPQHSRRSWCFRMPTAATVIWMGQCRAAIVPRLSGQSRRKAEQ